MQEIVVVDVRLPEGGSEVLPDDGKEAQLHHGGKARRESSQSTKREHAIDHLAAAEAEADREKKSSLKKGCE